KMPKSKSKLRPDEIDALVEWIKAGAPWPASTSPAPAGPPPAVVKEMDVTAAHRAFWSIQPLKKPAVPSVRAAGWAKSDIDRFILARLETDNLSPVAAADKLTLIRRATFDLTGVPPSPEDVDAFEQDTSLKAFETVVDRLLSSPHYGEHWGRHWLDLVRYADTAGENSDHPLPHAWRYRNWVIKSFNDNKPYDEFLREQIAG